MKIQFVSKLSFQSVIDWNKKNEYAIQRGLKPRLVWVNKKQAELLNTIQKLVGCLMGRGSGKSTVIHFSMAQKILMMPRGSFFLAGPTLKQLQSKTLRGLESNWAALGWVEGRDYHFGKPPLPDWDLPYNAPQAWSNCYVHRNGSYVELLTSLRSATERGGSFDGGDIDEAAICKKTLYEDVILPSMRGNIQHFKNNPLWQSIRVFTSMPTKTEGYWIFDLIEEKYKNEVLAKGEGNCTDFYWMEGNCYDNIEIFGEDGIRRLRESMSHLKFQIEVLNMRISKAERGFYPQFNEERHVRHFPVETMYDPKTGAAFKGYSQLKRDEPIDLSFDFGGWFNCCIAEQYFERENIDRTFKEFHRDGEDTLRGLVQDVCRFFDKQGQRLKLAHVYGEPQGHKREPDGKRMFERVRTYFNDNGWQCEVLVAQGSKSDNHVLRFEEINEMLAQTNDSYPIVQINQEGCPNLITCLQTAEIKSDSTKDKRHEKNRDFPQHLATHYTDVFDYKKMQRFLKATKKSNYRPNAAGII